MTRLILDSTKAAFFDLTLAQREEGVGVIAQLRVPGGIGRSSLVVHEEFLWPDGFAECRAFIHRLNTDELRKGAALLRNARVLFSFWQLPDGAILFETRAIVDGGEITFRTHLDANSVRRFHQRLQTICDSLVES